MWSNILSMNNRKYLSQTRFLNRTLFFLYMLLLFSCQNVYNILLFSKMSWYISKASFFFFFFWENGIYLRLRNWFCFGLIHFSILIKFSRWVYLDMVNPWQHVILKRIKIGLLKLPTTRDEWGSYSGRYNC